MSEEYKGKTEFLGHVARYNVELLRWAVQRKVPKAMARALGSMPDWPGAAYGSARYLRALSLCFPFEK